MGTVLIASLGESPGVITALLDALIENNKRIDKVIPIYMKPSNYPGYTTVITELKREFKSYEKYENIIFEYKDSWVDGIDIGGKDEKGYASSDKFFKKAIKIIDICKRNGCNVIVGIGGGRKTMSALMTYAALINDVQNIYQIIVSDFIENIGKPNNWNGDSDTRERALHPAQNERWLVKLPTRSDIVKYYEKIQGEGAESINDDDVIIEQPTPAL